MAAKLLILGDRTANEVLESARLACESDFAEITKLYFDADRFESEDAPAFEAQCEQVYFHVGVANVTLKSKMLAACSARNWTPYSVIHPTAVLSPSAQIGLGVYIGPLAVVSSNAIVGDHSIVHIHASIGHDVQIEESCAVLPGARISGNVHLGPRTLVGSNAFIAASVSVGADCQVDALTYVRNNLPDGHIASTRTSQPVRRIDLK